MRVAGRLLAVGVMLPALAGCAGGLPGALTESDGAKFSLGGRWMLAAPSGPPCGVTLAENSPSQGRITPDGGCPGAFFRSRRWAFEQNTLTIKDDADEPLGRLTFDGTQFQGSAVTGTPLRLTRPVLPTQ
jgi:hypothetical protein